VVFEEGSFGMWGGGESRDAEGVVNIGPENIKSSSSGVLILIDIYMDDILLATDDPRETDEVNRLLASEY
jgi:hypothetical protein